MIISNIQRDECFILYHLEEKLMDFSNKLRKLKRSLRKLTETGRIVEYDAKFSTDFDNKKLISDIKLDEILLELYMDQSNGILIEWFADDENDIRGKMNFLKMEHVLGDWKGVIYFDEDEEANSSICNYRPFDFITDEASCGFCLDPETKEASKEIYYNYAGESGMQGLDLDFAGYFEMLLEAKAFFYWPKVLIDLQNGTECPETSRFQKAMPGLFEDFSFEEFAAKYESLRLTEK